MTSFVITGNSTTAQTLAAGENGFVGAVGSLYTETATAVTITGTASLTVMGAVATAEASAAVRTSGTAEDVRIVLGTQGSITSGLTDAIRLSISSDFDLRNAGLISGNATGIFVEGITTGTQRAEITNDGTIMARSTALFFGDALETVLVSNSGTIMNAQGSRTAIDAGGNSFVQNGPVLYLSNTGDIIGKVSSRDSFIVNEGQIRGDLSTDYLSLNNTGTINGWITASSGTVTNTGDILGLMQLYDNFAIENAGRIGNSIQSSSGGADLTLANSGHIHGNVIGLGGLTIENLGTITGFISNVSMGSTGETVSVTNSGHIGGTVTFNSSNDVLINRGGTVAGLITGGGGNDEFYIDRGDLLIDGGDGTDTVISTASYRMGTGIEALVLQGPEGLTGIGRDGNETIIGGDGNDTLIGRAGNDSLGGAGGDDLVRGNAGNDALSLTDGTDTLDGGTGVDTLILGSGLRYTVNLATGTATGLDAAGETDRSATLSRIENVSGADLNDAITGSAGNNLLQGNSGFDTLGGGNGNDTLSGGDGADSLTGGSGADVLIGGAGADTMTGGTQADTFQFFAVSDSATGAADRITDFSVVDDTIDLAAVDADPVAGGDQVFVFVGTAAFAGLGAQVRYAQDAGAGTTTVQVRLAGDAITDMEIVLTGLHTLTAADFVL